MTHPGRVPPAVPWDETAAARAAGSLASWVAGCTGGSRVRVRAVTSGDVVGSFEDVVAIRPGGALPSVGHVAAAVDRGRELVAVAAADGVTVLVVAGTGDPAAVARVGEWLGGEARGPLGALGRLGGEDLCVLCGAALGAGEQGLALAFDGPAGTAAARLALAVQPALAPRVRSLASLDLQAAPA